MHGIDWGQPQRMSADFAYSEAGAAESFTAAEGLRLRYDHRRGRHLLWSGHRWAPDVDGAVMRVALEHVRREQHRSLDVKDGVERQKAIEHWSRFDRRAMLENMLAFARTFQPIADAGDRWDDNDWILGCPNGVVDLRTGQLRHGAPSDRVTMNTAVPFDPDACCQAWERFLLDVFNGDADLIGFIHRSLGYSITGTTDEQVLFLGHGTGANGKGVLMRTVGYILGDYHYTMPFSTIEMHQRSGIPNDLAAIVGRRFVMSSETNDGTRINESRVKALTGSDPMTARFLHGEFFTFTPRAKFWLAVNHLPVVKDDSHAFWRRIRQVPFTRTFDVNPGFEDTLKAEAVGILAWLVRGCLRWQAEGLQPPAAVSRATDTYRRNSDVLADFLDEACDLEPHAEVTAQELFNHYIAWATRTGLNDRERLTSTRFGTKVAERFERVHRRIGKVYLGLARRS